MNGIKRRSSPFNINRLDHLYQDPHVDHQRFKLHYGDPADASDLIRIVLEVKVEV